MKQLLLILAFLTGICVTAHAQTIKLVPSAGDATRMDTVVIGETTGPETDAEIYPGKITFSEEDLKGVWSETSIMAMAALIICCGLPFFIVGIVLWFRYKNKQAKYKLAAEALAAGQTIPEALFRDKENRKQEILSKGIRNIFLGIGLGVFFWVLTRHGGLTAIGFLVFCMGLGQVLIAYTTGKEKDDKE